jgi:hypothetical protein
MFNGQVSGKTWSSLELLSVAVNSGIGITRFPVSSATTFQLHYNFHPQKSYQQNIPLEIH